MNNQTNKYLIEIESMYGEGVGNYYMISSDKMYIEMLRLELLKNIKSVEYTHDDGNLCGWLFYENIYNIINVKKKTDENYEYTLSHVHDYVYEPHKSKVKNLKKINWNKKINKKHFTIHKNFLMEENLVYNTINTEYDIININNFNILGDKKKHT